jgi:16S rRNA (guanine(527)-N(7))-methyltransferase RsmG
LWFTWNDFVRRREILFDQRLMAADNTDHISFVFRVLEAQGLAGRLDPTRLHAFLNELFRWNPRLGLVSKQDTPRIVAGLIGQSVRFWDFVGARTGIDPGQRGCRVADIGTGGGFPGMIWAILERGLQVVLVERKQRKTAYLERAAVKTGVDNVRVEAADLGEIARRDSYRHAFDLAVMMAVTRPGELAPDLATLLKDGGFFCTIRSGAEPEPPTQVGESLKVLASLVTPDGRFVIYEKTGEHGR